MVSNSCQAKERKLYEKWENTQCAAQCGFVETHLHDMEDVDRVMKQSSSAYANESPARQLASAIAKFDPLVAKLVRSARLALRKRFPTAIEQIYDNYNFLAIGLCTTERTSDCIVSLAVSAKGVALSFYYGASLPDPGKILLGCGKQNRYLRLDSAATLSRPEVESLLCAAVAQAKSPLPSTGRGYTMIKSVSAKQRSRVWPTHD
jgi:hypothetical protein